MGKLVRFGVSMDAELLAAFDGLVDRLRFANRSEAVREFVRRALIGAAPRTEDDSQTAILCVAGEAGAGGVASEVARVCGNLGDHLLGNMSVNLTDGTCAFVVLLRWSAEGTRSVAARFRALPGVASVKLLYPSDSS